jgi:hypothetical protein
MGLEFVPPKEWASYGVFKSDDDGGDKGTFKTTNSLSAAKYSFSYGRSYWKPAGKILELVDGKWYVLYDVPKGAAYKDLPWIKEVPTNRYTYRDTGTHPKAVPMTRNEYAEWRVQVERERVAKAQENRAGLKSDFTYTTTN